MLDFVLPFGPKIIIPQTISSQVNDFLQFRFEGDPLGWFDNTFEYRKLDTLPKIGTSFRNFPQPFCPIFMSNHHIIAYKNQQGSPPEERGVSIDITPDISREQGRLDMEQQSYRNCFLYVGMHDGLLLSPLIFN